LQFFCCISSYNVFFSTHLLAQLFDSRRGFNIVHNGSIAKFMTCMGGGMATIETLGAEGKMVGMPTPSDT
jgi:hypothetical protein